MLFKTFILSLSLLSITSFAQESQEQQAKQVISGFAKDLKHVLMSTMQSDGPVAAISVCNVSAPNIAQQHSQSPWQISRSSLRVRNPDNTPEPWLEKIMQEFASRHSQGEAISSIETSVTHEDSWFFVKAIPTAKPCLACHGSNLQPEVERKLAELYPNDQATGFSQGDIRGVFVVKENR